MTSECLFVKFQDIPSKTPLLYDRLLQKCTCPRCMEEKKENGKREGN